MSACYSPTVPAGAPCDLALNNCPAGQRCEMTASGAFCGAVPTLVDGPTSNGDGPDGPRPDTAPGCFGVGLIHD
ncbi:MAG TPA: hypothetical protein VFV99_24570, partial [Kofleriaceae bacterium]|nr:hypothetical protein [Kofleriaceae bacterium]